MPNTRRRYQEGSLTVARRSWVAQWYEDGHHRKRVLGRVSEVTKSQARAELEKNLSRLRERDKGRSPNCTFEDFVMQTFLPFYRRKWKASTAYTTEDRIKRYLIKDLGKMTVGSFTPEQLQDFLDRKAAEGLSFSSTAHLRWDLRLICRSAVIRGYIQLNPADDLFTPKHAARPQRKPIMTWGDLKLMGSLLELRERLIMMLAVICGLRPGEIFGLCWGDVQADHIEVRRRVYRGKIDTPKTPQSVRLVALSNGLQKLFHEWRRISITTKPDAWVFPSENLKTPLWKDNCWRRYIAPKLEKVGLGCVNFQVKRRTHASLMRQLNVDPKVVADQLGHTLDVNLNVYTQTALHQKKQAVNTLESALLASRAGKTKHVVM